MFRKLIILFFIGFTCAKDVTFYLRTRNMERTELTEKNLRLINPENPVKFIIHGFGGSSTLGWYEKMTDAYLKRGNFNIIHVDWFPLAFISSYRKASKNTQKVGKVVAKFIVKLNAEYSIPLDNVHVIGFSLGAHVAGYTGNVVNELTGQKIYRITGLDPAGPLFNEGVFYGNFPTELHAKNAKMVDITHTDTSHLGYKLPLGTVDFYANLNIHHQPACNWSKISQLIPQNTNIVACSHYMSLWYFIESINSKDFIAYRCGNKEDFNFGTCDENKKLIYGEDVPMDANGVYYFKTNDDEPYAISNK